MDGSKSSSLNSSKYDMDDIRFRIRPFQQISSACCGALITSLFMTPLDVVKTRLQTQQKILISNKCYLYCNGLMDHLCPCGPNGNINKKIHFNGTIDAFVKISRSEGIKSLWSGLSPTLVLALPATVIYFVSYEQLRVKLKDHFIRKESLDKTTSFLIPLAAGCSARVIAVTIVNPLELIRTKMQSQRLSYFEVGRAMKEMIAIEGLFGLWKGWCPTILRDVPFSGIYWASYETIKNHFNVSNPTFSFSFVSGAVSGSIAALVTTPFDVIKTHKQIEMGEQMIGGKMSTKNKSKTNARTLLAIRDIYMMSGIKGLFSGVIPRLAKVAPACAIMIGSFEYGKSFFYKHNIEQSLRYNNTKETIL